jgi:release factor glutamine methyltransferase
MGLRLETRPGVFIPRPETEVLVGAALDTLLGTTAPVVVDVGLGAGAVALALKQARPDARVIGTDVSDEAVTLTLANARRHGLEVGAIRGDLLSPLPEALRDRVDLVVSNPPYVAREDFDALPQEVRADPYDALVGGTEVHARLAREGPGWLGPGGWLVVEIGEDQGTEVKGLLSARLEDVEVLPDLALRDRVVRGRLPSGTRSRRHLAPSDPVTA